MSETDEITTTETSLVETLRQLDREWQSNNWPHETDVKPRSYYGLAADEIDKLNERLCAMGQINLNESSSARSEIERLREALDDLFMHHVAGPTDAWMMIPKSEYEQVERRFKESLSRARGEDGQ